MDSYDPSFFRSVHNKESERYKTISFCSAKNKKLQAGDVFIYRTPGKSTKDRKFLFFGGGVIESVNYMTEDEKGRTIATICKPFSFKTPLKQGDLKLENHQWEQKIRKPGKWNHFFSLDGVTEINFSDFSQLFNDCDIETVKPIVKNQFVLRDDIKEHILKKFPNVVSINDEKNGDWDFNIIQKDGVIAVKQLDLRKVKRQTFVLSKELTLTIKRELQHNGNFLILLIKKDGDFVFLTASAFAEMFELEYVSKVKIPSLFL